MTINSERDATASITQHDGLVSIHRALSLVELDDLLGRTALRYLKRGWLAPPSQFVVAGVKPGAARGEAK